MHPELNETCPRGRLCSMLHVQELITGTPPIHIQQCIPSMVGFGAKGGETIALVRCTCIAIAGAACLGFSSSALPIRVFNRKGLQLNVKKHWMKSYAPACWIFRPRCLLDHSPRQLQFSVTGNKTSSGSSPQPKFFGRS